MSTEDSKNEEKTSEIAPKERRNFRDRRVSTGRRDAIRFDETGGDRRSGIARRSTDVGIREQLDDDSE